MLEVKLPKLTELCLFYIEKMVNADLLTGDFPDNCSMLHFDEAHNKIIELKKNPNTNS